MFIQVVEGICIYLHCVLVISGYISIFVYPTDSDVEEAISCIRIVDSDDECDHHIGLIGLCKFHFFCLVY